MRASWAGHLSYKKDCVFYLAWVSDWCDCFFDWEAFFLLSSCFLNLAFHFLRFCFLTFVCSLFKILSDCVGIWLCCYFVIAFWELCDICGILLFMNSFYPICLNRFWLWKIGNWVVFWILKDILPFNGLSSESWNCSLLLCFSFSFKFVCLC